ncbi:MAG: DsbA family protein [Rhodospirillales bacterium]|nr:DsbA family protein [Rhodospirillales bacterium]
MRRLFLVLAALAALFAAPSARAQDAFTPAQREAIRKLMIETLRAHPELVLEALEALESKRENEQQARVQAVVREKRKEIFEDADAPMAGNPAASVTIVEFFDYRCPYCKQMQAPMQALLAADKDVRVVRKDLPILGPASVVAARAALASRSQGKYPAFHDALLGFRGQLDEAGVFRLAGQAGLDIEKLRRDMDAPGIAALIQRNMALAQALGISGTPAFVVGETLVPGAIDPESLRKLVADARAKR